MYTNAQIGRSVMQRCASVTVKGGTPRSEQCEDDVENVVKTGAIPNEALFVLSSSERTGLWGRRKFVAFGSQSDYG